MTKQQIAQEDARQGMLAVSQAISVLRAGLLVRITDAHGTERTVLAAETASGPSLREHTALVMTAARGARLGHAGGAAVRLEIAGAAAEDIEAMVDPACTVLSPTAQNLLAAAAVAEAAERAALLLLKHASLLPVALVTAQDNPVVCVRAEAIDGYADALADTLHIVSEAQVPLELAENARVVAFRSSGGMMEQLAIVVGDPAAEDAPLVRVHSSCLTGDLLGSLRCDCGAQLHAALKQIGVAGSGVVLYLNQEGRGIGIANKLRAYGLQDGGLDTLDANEQLGFAPDERQFRPAIRMLALLGITRLRLLTNNPSKVEALEAGGVAVAARLPLVIPAGAHNHHYLETKAARCGHVFYSECE